MAELIEAHVPFAASTKPPFDQSYPEETVAETVLGDAERYFQVTTDGTTRYYLFAAGQEVSPSTTLRDLLHAGGQGSHEHKLTLKLRTETISG
jgi:hypothetical protein